MKLLGLAGVCGAAGQLVIVTNSQARQPKLGKVGGLQGSWQVSRIAKPVSQDWDKVLGAARIGVKMSGLAGICRAAGTCRE